MNCKVCEKPVEATIEGELICPGCWSWGQMSAEERTANLEVAFMLSHCSDCEKELKTKKEKDNMRCTSCQQELETEMF